MKCKLLRVMEQRNPAYDPAARAAALKARRPYDVPKTVEAPAGTEIEHPDAWRLVRLGVAEPADDECATVANVPPEDLARRAAKYDKLAAGRATGDRTVDVAGPAEGGGDEDE